MGERADYYVEKVHYNKGHNKIVWVSVREDEGHRLGGAYNMLRKKMLSLIKSGKAFMTIHRNEEGKYHRGQKLVVIQIKGAGYLRTDAEPVETDSIQDIPEF